MGSGVLIRLADLLGDATPLSKARLPRGNQIVYSDTAGGVAVITLAALLCGALILLVVWLWVRKNTSSVQDIADEYREKTSKENWPDLDDPVDLAWVNRVRRFRSSPGLPIMQDFSWSQLLSLWESLCS